jgi:hypothetical protein
MHVRVNSVGGWGIDGECVETGLESLVVNKV